MGVSHWLKTKRKRERDLIVCVNRGEDWQSEIVDFIVHESREMAKEIRSYQQFHGNENYIMKKHIFCTHLLLIE